MTTRIEQLIEEIRIAQGPWFVARLSLRLKFRISGPDVVDTDENLHQLGEACREMGYDPELRISTAS